MPRVSVLMPARNSAPTVRAALTSTLRALPHDSEVVVWDDASSDDTAEVVHRVRDSRVRLMTAERPLGVAGALNALLDASDSEFVARMDADDVSFPWRFSRQLSVATGRRVNTFGAVVVFGRGVIPRPSSTTSMSAKAWSLALLYGNPGAHSSFFGLRSDLQSVGGYRRCLAEDYDLWLRMAAIGCRTERLAAPLIGLRQHAAQVTRTTDWHSAASRQTEWHDSYTELVCRLFAGSLNDSWVAALQEAPTPWDKAGLVSERIDRATSDLSGLDRRALRKMRRRSQLQLGL